MSIQEKINADLKKAMKEKDEVRLSCLRLLKAAMKNLQVEKRRELQEEEIEAVISSMVKRGKEAVEEFKKGGRGDLVQKEEKEIAIFQSYLPEQLQREEIEEMVKEIISELSASSPRDLGNVMKVAMARMAGRVQGKEVNSIAQRLLQQHPFSS
jgi:uncharacterized protein